VRLACLRHEGRVRVAEAREDAFLLFGPTVSDNWPDLLADPEALATLPRDERIPADEVPELLPPVPNPQKIFCIGANYEAHRIEMGRDVPAHPLVFMRTAMTLRGHGQPLWCPPESEQLDYEGEIAVVIGRPGRRILESRAWAHVAGLSLFDDATVRDWQRHSSQFTAGKNFDATGAFGPWIVTTDEAPPPGQVELTTHVNSTLRQSGVLSDLTFSIPKLVAYLSTFTTLLPGDVIVTGTPRGVGHALAPPVYLEEGDVVRIRGTGLGRLENAVIRDPMAD